MIDSQWKIKCGYFFTYLGEIYHGIAFQIDPNDNHFFIISKQKFYELNGDIKISTFDFSKNSIRIENEEIIERWVEETQVPENASLIRSLPWNDAKEFKKMYIFGAGASAFCQLSRNQINFKMDNFSPPLGNELFADRFDDLINKYPGLKSILPRFEINDNQIESILEKDWETLMKKKDVHLISQHIQIQFFIKELFTLVSGRVTSKYFRHNLYMLFVDKYIKNCPQNEIPVLVSFNYDTILDDILAQEYNIDFLQLNDYISPSEDKKILLFKPHGSANWGWEFNNNVAGLTNKNLADYLYNDRITPCSIYYGMLKGEIFHRNVWGLEANNHPDRIGKITPNKDQIMVITDNNKCYLPALLLPYSDKDEFVMPYNHQLKLETTIGNVEELVLIGWKGNEKLFNSKLKSKASNLKKLIIVNPDSISVKREMEQYLDLSNIEILEFESFEKYIYQQEN